MHARVVECAPSTIGLAMRRTPAEIEERLANLPQPAYPDDLPVVAMRDEIARAIGENQVVIICGETGSGKTTQLPKICLELQRGVTGLIGHTQPRRIAARTVATRIAQELKSPLGQAVGYKVRFSDKVSRNTYIKLMTDGILLAETQGDRDLRAYDTLIIDEAHERSLNIDFLLGYLKRLLPRRPDLKVIVTSATIDAERFATHFGHNGTAAPVIEVSGRMFPVEVRYRPLKAKASLTPGPAPGGGGGSCRKTKTSKRPSLMPWTISRGRGQAAIFWCFCPANARYAKPPKRCASTTPAARRFCRCSRGCRLKNRTVCSNRTVTGVLCWRPT